MSDELKTQSIKIDSNCEIRLCYTERGTPYTILVDYFVFGDSIPCHGFHLDDLWR
jgi:hypothetical protein